MTIIGKILTFLIFVFSLLFLGFAIIINNTNKDPRNKNMSWYERVKQLEAGQKNYVEDLKAKQEEIASLLSQNIALGKELAETRARHETQVTELTNKASVAENAKENAVTKLAQNQVVISTIQSDNEKRVKENLELSERLKQAEITKSDLIQKLTSANNGRVAAQIERDTLRSRLDETEKEIARLGREIENNLEKNMQRQSAADAGKSQPPPTDVQGVVTGVSSDGAYISLNKGSDHGLAKNQTLEVYRMNPKADWLARIRIIQVNDHEAVGMIVMPTNRKVTIVKGDLVGSSILPAGVGR
ncbi:MAG TPA: hypothetical protein PLN21_05390 [Gemmatales bacterium]|nr:hypothetical protein [Gemmatales bacterium]